MTIQTKPRSSDWTLHLHPKCAIGAIDMVVAIIQGRMIDLVNEQVVLDINGVRREIPLRDLCDVDLAYVGKVWHLPVTCGSGYEQVPGRSFTPSAIQWKASGLCHKPLYFEEVQLERYGHEIGPVLQPLVSTAHFFGNIAVLPYKMGIHPPTECQYALGLLSTWRLCTLHATASSNQPAWCCGSCKPEQ